MGNSSKRDRIAAEQNERRRKALELRKAGANYQQIADRLGLANKSMAWQAVHAAIRDIVREPAEAVLTIELARLDALLLGVWTAAKAGDVRAIDRALRIMERRSAYLGLDAPKRTEHTGKDGGPIELDLSKLTEAQIDRLLEARTGADLDRLLAEAVGAAPSQGAVRGGEVH